jgi:hypothetical protein
VDKIDVPNSAQPGSVNRAGRRVGLYPVSWSSKGAGTGKDLDGGDKAGFEPGGDLDRSEVGREEERADGDSVLGPDMPFFSLLWLCRCRWMRQYIA